MSHQLIRPVFFLHVRKCKFKRLQIAQLFENFSSAGKGFCVKMSANYKYFVWKHLITFKSERLYSFEPKTEYKTNDLKAGNFVYRCNG